jgi:hypothetical protein
MGYNPLIMGVLGRFGTYCYLIDLIKFIAVDNPSSGIVVQMDRSRPVPTIPFSCFVVTKRS